MLKPILLAAASLAAAANLSPAFAKPITPEIRTVAYADLDLSTTAGRSRLERRIQAAVRDVCGEALPSFDLARRHAVRACLVETRANVQLPAPVAAELVGAR
jgi:UrcA family protein